MSGAALTERLLAALVRRAPLLREPQQDALRWLNGSGDGVPGLLVDRLGDARFVHAEEGAPTAALVAALRDPAVVAASGQPSPRSIWVKPLLKNVRAHAKEELLPQLVFGETGEAGTAGERNGDAGPEFAVQEGAWRFLVRPREGYSHGLFLDQRDNRVRLAEWLRQRAARGGPPPTVLNTFAYTCSFSVVAAAAGARATSVDLSARYLEWGQRNFAANGLDAAAHEFARGDALTYLAIAAKKGRRFDALVLDPPTFSTSKQRGVFQVERHYDELAALAFAVAAPDALLLASHNQRTFTRDALAAKLHAAARTAGRRLARLDPFAPPLDFPGPPAENPASRGFWIAVE